MVREHDFRDCDFWEVDGWPNRTSRLVVISHQGFTSSDASEIVADPDEARRNSRLDVLKRLLGWLEAPHG